MSTVAGDWAAEDALLQALASRSLTQQVKQVMGAWPVWWPRALPKAIQKSINFSIDILVDSGTILVAKCLPTPLKIH